MKSASAIVPPISGASRFLISSMSEPNLHHPAAETRTVAQSISGPPASPTPQRSALTRPAITLKEIPPANPSESDAEKNKRLSLTVIHEIMSTEADYVEDLNILLDVFYRPLEIKLHGTIRKEELEVLFSNVKMLLGCNMEMIKLWQMAAEDGKEEIDAIADIFESMSPYLKMYTVYCSGQPQSTAKFKEMKKMPAVVQTLKVCESDSRCRNLTLNDFLIKPVQRICKYPLFFAQLLKFTSESEPAYVRLRDCQKKIEATAEHINEFRRVNEKLQRIVEIQDSFDPPLPFDLVQNQRRLIKESVVSGKINGGEAVEYHLFMFSDLVLVAKKKKSSTFHLKLKIPIEELRFVEMADTSDYINAFVLEQNGGEGSVFCMVANKAEKTAWQKDTKALLNDYKKRNC